MRVFNYSDRPVQIMGVPHDDIEINIPYEGFDSTMITHHTKTFNQISQHQYLTIYNDQSLQDGYAYRITEPTVPDITIFSLILISTIGFHLLIKIIQKVKQA